MSSSNEDHNKAGNKQEEEDPKKWGTHVMGQPANPTVHPDNQQAAQWKAQGPNPQHYADPNLQNQQHPYVVYSPAQRSDNPIGQVVSMFNAWSHRAEEVARNVWHNLKTGPSVSGAAWGKVNLTAKAITEGGFESIFRQAFSVDPDEKLKKSFACYFSTTTGPVAGTLYLSTARVAFCSDRPLSFKAPSGQETWSYYKVAVPLGSIESVSPVVMKENPPEKYIQITTVDRHEFWFMGFVNYDKASHHLLDDVSDFRARGSSATAAPPQPHTTT